MLEKKVLYEMASGKIENPSLELEVEGEIQKFEGRDARVFAFGMLAGIKAATDGMNVERTED